LLAALLAASQAGAADKKATPAAPAAATAKPTAPPRAKFEPTGVGNAKFGMSLAEVWKMYPKAKLMGEEEQGGAPVLEGPYIDRLLIKDQKVPGFEKPTTLELRFWNGKLWAVIVYFGDNDAETSRASLLKIFGPQASDDGANDNLTWYGEKANTTATFREKWYGTSDNALSAQARGWFSDMLNGIWKGETPEEKAAREARMAALTPKSAKSKATTPTPGAPAPAATPAAK
jgi:hypothetical protein